MSHKTPETCYCYTCVRSRNWTRQIEASTLPHSSELLKIINEMRGLICDLEADLDWLRTKDFRAKKIREALEGEDKA